MNLIVNLLFQEWNNKHFRLLLTILCSNVRNRYKIALHLKMITYTCCGPCVALSLERKSP